MPISDLNEVDANTTSEEIAAYAEQVAKEIESDRQGDNKSDAEITNSQADLDQTENNKTSVEENSDDETTKEGEESGNKSVSTKWITEKVKAEAAAYGLSESDLADFSSREELDKALRLFDKTALESGRKALASSENGTDRNEKGQFVKKEEKPDDSKEPPKNGRYEVSLSPDVYDENLISEFNRMRDHYESRLEVLESHFAESSAKAEEQKFDSFVDSLGHPDLFGTTGKESVKELERRKDLMVNVRAHLIGLQLLGRPTEMSKELINRVVNMTFAEEIGKKLLKQKTAKVAKQSDGRLGGSPTKPLPPSDNPRDHFDRMYKQLAGKS